MADRHSQSPGGVAVSKTAALTGLLLLATVTALYFAANILVPIAFAVFLNVLLSPIVRALGKRKVPASVSAGMLVSGMVSMVILFVSLLAEPAGQWLHDAPRSIRDLQAQVFTAKDKIANIQEIAKEVGELTSTDSPGRTQEVVVKDADLVENLVGSMPTVLAFAGIVIFLTFFLLASGDTLLRRMTHCGRNWSEQRRIVTIAKQIQSDLSRYLWIVTTINLLLGIAVALTMHLLDVPNPFLWGVMVALFNFAPYLGAVTSTGILLLVGLTTFDTLADAIVAPATFLVLTIIEGQLVTPAIVGRRMALSPVFIFLSVVFWGWLWGIAGALMAVPIVTSFKVICDHVPALEPLAEFIRNEKKGPQTADGLEARHVGTALTVNRAKPVCTERGSQSGSQEIKSGPNEATERPQRADGLEPISCS